MSVYALKSYCVSYHVGEKSYHVEKTSYHVSVHALKSYHVEVKSYHVSYPVGETVAVRVNPSGKQVTM